MNHHPAQDETERTSRDQTTPTEAPVSQRRFPLPLGMVLLIVGCGLAGPVCYFGLAVLRNYGWLS